MNNSNNFMNNYIYLYSSMHCNFLKKKKTKKKKHTCHKLWTKICEIRQNVKEDLTKFCEIFLNITLGLPQYSLKSFFFYVRSL